MKELRKETKEAFRASLGKENIRPQVVQEVVVWVKERNRSIFASLKPTTINDCKPWFCDESDSSIHNENGSFFSIRGLSYKTENKEVLQPIILQNEVGYLGFICRNHKGVLEFLIQAKIEPGNVNKVQLSPTIQATRSNFTQKHGGRKPLYLEYFVDVDKYEVLCDYDEPEQCARFLGKYNRNVAIVVDEEVEISENFRWLNLAEIKEIMNRYDNLVNMDTRTIISCLPYADCLIDKRDEFSRSLLGKDNSVSLLEKLDGVRKNHKVERSVCRLDELKNWKMDEAGIRCPNAPFSVVYYDICIEGREKTEWKQPLFKAEGSALFGTIVRKNPNTGELELLMNIKEEVGAKDFFIFAPFIQKEASEPFSIHNGMEKYFYNRLENKKNLLSDVVLSEEGGRFFQEQNRNVIVWLDKDIETPEGSYWANFATISSLIRRQDPVVNIQMRNLFSLVGGGKSWKEKLG